jgi:NDP-sugar pyrophosphorylase family protein
MRPSTDTCPKSMLPVEGKPFVDYQLTWLKAEGFTDAVFSIGHLGEMIRDYVGDGSRWGVQVKYADEGERRLGTGGALRFALDLGLLDPVFAVMYGDSFLTVSVDAVWRRFEESGAPALMTVLRNDGRWDRSNVIYEPGRVALYDKRADPRPEAMRYIDYGLSVMRRELIEQRAPGGAAYDMAGLLHDLSREGKLAGFEATERFYEIGSSEGLLALAEFCSRRADR